MSNATHLIIGEKIKINEKVLCFIAAGKPILKKTYIAQCKYEDINYINENDHHISTKSNDEGDKIAKASLR